MSGTIDYSLVSRCFLVPPHDVDQEARTDQQGLGDCSACGPTSYFKLYSEVKVKHYLVHGPYHVLTQLRILKSLPMEVQDIVTPYIRTGAWYAHSECVLLSLLGSDVAEDRCFAIQLIFKKRGEEELGDLSLRDRVTPRLNL